MAKGRFPSIPLAAQLDTGNGFMRENTTPKPQICMLLKDRNMLV